MTVRTSSAPMTAALIGGQRVEYNQAGGCMRRTNMHWHRMQRGSGSRRRDRLSQSLFCLCSAGPARVCSRSPVVKRMKEGFSLGWNTRVTSDLLYYTRSSSAGAVMWVARQAIGLRRRQVRPRRSAANSTAILRVTALYSRRASSRGGCRALQLCSCNGSTALQPLHSTALYMYTAGLRPGGARRGLSSAWTSRWWLLGFFTCVLRWHIVGW